MKKVLAFFQLVRWPNLLFMALTQVLFHYFLLVPVLQNEAAPRILNDNLFLLLLFSSLCIAAAGYIINDYFDINIDRINKPERQFIPKPISRRWAIFWHSFLTFTGVVLGFYTGYKLGIWWIGPSHVLCSFLLFVYSTTFKKKLLAGNIIIALLTAWTVALIGLLYFYSMYFSKSYSTEINSAVLRFTILYSAFAFIISLIREAIKDMEDMEGDRQFGCKTLPIVAGITAAKTYTLVWMVVLAGALIIVQLYAAQLGWWSMVVYSVLCILLPLAYLFKKFIKPLDERGYHQLSSLTKLIIFTGILSLIFFRIYI